MKKIILIASLSMLYPSISFSEANLTLYSNKGFYGNTENKNFENKINFISVPNSVLKDTFNLKLLDNPTKIKKTEYQRNDIQKLLKENIGSAVTFNEKTYTLKDTYGNFLILKNNQDKTVYAQFSKIDSIELENNIPLKEGVFKITLKKPVNDTKISYNYAFDGIRWSANHKLYIDPENNIKHDYNFLIENNTEVDFDNINLNLISGDIKLNSNQPVRRNYAMLESSRGASDIAQANFESFSGFRLITLPEKITINNNTTTELFYRTYNNFPNKREYVFPNFYNQDQVVKNIHPNMNLILERENNKDYQFPFSAGKISVYKLDPEEPKDISKATIINSTQTKNYSKDENVIVDLGEAFDVYANYKSELLSKGLVQTESHYRYSINTYKYTVEVTNNEPTKAFLKFNFNNSENVNKPIEEEINGKSKKEFTFNIQYKERI